jgi:hypothetical protein
MNDAQTPSVDTELEKPVVEGETTEKELETTDEPETEEAPAVGEAAA